NSLKSIRLLERIGLQVGRFRILLDRHVMEQESHQMSLLDAQIATVRKQFNDSAREYETVPWYPGEQYGWERLKRDLAEVDESVPATLADSRQNRDEQARARIAQLEPRFAAIERDVDALVEINQKGGAESTAKIRNMQVSELVTSALLSLVAVITVLVVAALT